MADSRINLYMITEQFDKTYNNIEKRMDVLEKKKHTIGLSVDDKKVEKVCQEFEKYIDLLKEKDRLEKKQSTGNLNTRELAQLNDINTTIEKKGKLLDKEIQKLEDVDKIAMKQIQRGKELADVRQKANSELSKEVQMNKENLEIQKQNTAEVKKQEQELNRLHQKAKEVGQLTKSMLQDMNLNKKNAKNTQAQYDYQINAIKKLIGEIGQAENAQEGLNHAMESMVYELKHTSGKELYEDSLNSIKELTSLENKRAQAQKSGQTIMESYYNSEIQKQQEVYDNLQKLINNPNIVSLEGLEQLKTALPELATQLQEQYEKTGELQTALTDGAKEYIQEQYTIYQNLIRENQVRQQQTEQNQQYEELKRHIQEIYSLEEKLEKLKKDKSGNKSEIRATEEILKNKKAEYQIEEQIKKLEGSRKSEIDAITKKHLETLKVIESQKNKTSELGDTIKKVFNYVAVYKGFTLLTQGIQQAIDTMRELDKAFTDIQMVTMGTNEETAQLAQEYNALAKSLGATTTEVAAGAGEWLRQGKTAEETTKLLTASMTFSKVGAIEASEATELLTSSLNGYKLEAEDAMSVVDKISAIDLAAATSSEELATALARTANIANDSSVSFDKLLAMIGTVSSVTRRSASTIRRSI